MLGDLGFVPGGPPSVMDDEDYLPPAVPNTTQDRLIEHPCVSAPPGPTPTLTCAATLTDPRLNVCASGPARFLHGLLGFWQ